MKLFVGKVEWFEIVWNEMEWLEWFAQRWGIHISPISFFHFFQLSLIFQIIPFHFIFFPTIFFNFSNLYTISLNLYHSYHFEIRKVKLFLHHFQTISNHFFHPKK